MAATNNSHRNPFETPFDHSNDSAEREDWGDWSDDERVKGKNAPAEPQQLLIHFEEPSSPESMVKSQRRSVGPKLTSARYSVQKPKRLKSRGRQKAANARAGIKLITDMTKLGRQQHVAQQLRPGAAAPDGRVAKFVDAAALRALEGDQTSESVGSWHWLKRKASKKNAGHRASMHLAVPASPEQGLSPSERPIMIGISVPSEYLSEHEISPQTATVETPVDIANFLSVAHPSRAHQPSQLSHSQQSQSYWSPDTEASQSPPPSSRAASSIYSQPGRASHLVGRDVPPVPALPPHLRNQQNTKLGEATEEDDIDTPVTLFEEDGSPVATRKSLKLQPSTKSPDHTRRRSQGWWDQVTTPFREQSNSPLPPAATVTAKVNEEWWRGADEKKPPPLVTTTTGVLPRQEISPPIRSAAASIHSMGSAFPIGVDEAVSSRPSPSHEDKARMLAEENENPIEQPPPYSPPSKQSMVKYQAIMPPGHPLAAQNQAPPSPGPISPGLVRTMTSQGGITMVDIPLSPPPHGQATTYSDAPLPPRLAGTYVTGDHFLAAEGDINRVERQRRRDEKEDVYARKAGGLWRGRACIPQNGCFGRGGREGRKRRRVCLGIFAGVIITVILIAVLATTLAQKRSSPAAVPESVWLNLTGFPPVPTGVLTVAGTENSKKVTACVQPSTLWSCSIPKEQQEANAPYEADQPSFVIQIQFDNSSDASWNVTDEEPPHPVLTTTKTSSATSETTLSPTSSSDAEIRRLRPKERRDAEPGFSPNPDPPSFQEMWFLGNSTDGIVSDDKAGEPTPFFISFLQSTNDTVESNALGQRDLRKRQDVGVGSGNKNGSAGWDIADLLPPPELNADGTGAAARVLPRPTQQPLRLYDRGLPTEHLGFYTYFNKTIYLRSVTNLDDDTASQGEVPDDEDGGSLQSAANFVVTWSETRFRVQIWTRADNDTELLGGGGGSGGGEGEGEGNADANARPGTFPYPVTITEDTHGGDPRRKSTWFWRVDARQHINTTDPKLIINDIGFNAEVVNPKNSGDPSWGGFDGGVGGCKCDWQNFVNAHS